MQTVSVFISNLKLPLHVMLKGKSCSLRRENKNNVLIGIYFEKVKVHFQTDIFAGFAVFVSFKMIPQKKNLSKNLFFNFLIFSLPMPFTKSTEKIDHRAYLRDIRGKTHPIRDRTGTNHARHFIGPQLILRWLESRVFKVTLEKNLTGRQSHAFEKI